MSEIRDYPNCFVCGEKNEIGLKIKFTMSGGAAKAEYTPARAFEGYKDVLHGGIISTLLDEVMIYAVFSNGHLAVTSQMEVKFKMPAKIGQRLRLEGRIKDDRGRLIFTEGKILNQDGGIVATATGKYYKAEGTFKKQLEQNLGLTDP
ncbi:MAG: PaaI family thioesterase [Candidatus Aminicenantes bacterium]|nr:PaaI family thioesterase [Candidatus Aminicenantes bacterium]